MVPNGILSSLSLSAFNQPTFNFSRSFSIVNSTNFPTINFSGTSLEPIAAPKHGIEVTTTSSYGIRFQSYGWGTYLRVEPTLIGTVGMTIDLAHNTTILESVSMQNVQYNDTKTLWTRTDTNSLGTVTAEAVLSTGSGGLTRTAILTFPTEISNIPSARAGTTGPQDCCRWASVDRGSSSPPDGLSNLLAGLMPGETLTRNLTTFTAGTAANNVQDSAGLLRYLSERDGTIEGVCYSWTTTLERSDSISTCLCTECVESTKDNCGCSLGGIETVDAYAHIRATTTTTLSSIGSVATEAIALSMPGPAPAITPPVPAMPLPSVQPVSTTSNAMTMIIDEPAIAIEPGPTKTTSNEDMPVALSLPLSHGVDGIMDAVGAVPMPPNSIERPSPEDQNAEANAGDLPQLDPISQSLNVQGPAFSIIQYSQQAIGYHDRQQSPTSVPSGIAALMSFINVAGADINDDVQQSSTTSTVPSESGSLRQTSATEGKVNRASSRHEDATFNFYEPVSESTNTHDIDRQGTIVGGDHGSSTPGSTVKGSRSTSAAERPIAVSGSSPSQAMAPSSVLSISWVVQPTHCGLLTTILLILFTVGI